jgi:hypothetical protein
MDFPLDVLVLNLDNFFEFGFIVEVLAVVGLVQRKVRVVCGMSAIIKWRLHRPLLTFQSSNDAQDYGICHDVFDDGCVV